MSRPVFRLTVWHAMLGVGVMGMSFALLRGNGALAIIDACVSSMTLVRTVRNMRHRRVTARRAALWQWFCSGLTSLVVSAAIIGSADFTFLLIYTGAELLRRGGAAHPPPPELNRAGILIGAPSGLIVGHMVRRWLWDRRSVPGDSV